MGHTSTSAASRNNGEITRKPQPPVEHQFKAGNPGRPKGARHKLGTAFLEQMLADFETHGKDVIESVRKDKPDQYLKVIASILPKEIDATVDITATTKEQRDAAAAAFVRAAVETMQ